ncbi:hypothetical protein [Undibacterium sp. SXout20W]|uniref:hypothetical protein n=1 Tax=Undibacterium sp. SXout20W TaxID=3413051 RepID=UPI003BF55B31
MKNMLNSPMNSPMNARMLQTILRLQTEGGQSSVEYAIVCAAFAFALGVGLVDDSSVLWQLISAFKLAYQKFSFALSLPT